MWISTLALIPVLLGAQQCPAMTRPEVEAALACFVDGTPACPEGRRCAEIHLHVVVGSEGPVQSPQWLAESLEHAHLLFEPAGVGFRVAAVDAIGPEFERVATRAQRDAIGRQRFGKGVIHVFLVGRLDDVDLPGEQIRGVHWRQRSNTDKRWIIASKIGSKIVLGHELGHFFGLPHSRYTRSVMNKAPREQPPWDERVFVPDELAIVEDEAARMFADGSLVDE